MEGLTKEPWEASDDMTFEVLVWSLSVAHAPPPQPFWTQSQT